MASSHLESPPDPEFWLAQLRLGEFPSLSALADDPIAARARAEAELTGAAARQVLDLLRARYGDTAELHTHLVMVAAAMRLKKSTAIADVAWARLTTAEVRARVNGGRRVQRLALAALLYEQDPLNLLAVQVCHLCHARRRVAFEVKGHRRKLPEGVDWGGAAVAGLEVLRVRHPHELVHRITLKRPDTGEVLLAFSEAGGREVVDRDDGGSVPGTKPEWTMLRFLDAAMRVDVTGRNPRLAAALAGAVATAAFGTEIAYRRCKHAVTGKVLDELLSRLRHPDNDVWPLLEITAELPGLPGVPAVTVTNAGDLRIEPAVQEMRRHMAFADTWQHVHKVKVGFGEHRYLVHFPRPDDPEMLLPYSDQERDKNRVPEFEQLFEDELGVRIHPKAERRRQSKRPEAAEPRSFGAATWQGLLAPKLDQPARWQLAALEELALQGIIEIAHAAVFRCGDPDVNRRYLGAHDTLDCPGEIEMPWAPVDPTDPLRQEEGREFECGTCGFHWKPWAYRLPITRRARVRILPDATWRWLLGKVASMRFQELRPGVAFAVHQGRMAYLVLPALASNGPELDPSWAAVHSACWVLEPGDGGFGDRGVSLGAVLTEGDKAIGRVLALGPAGGALPATAQPALAAESSPPVYTASPSARFLNADDGGIWLDARRLADVRATGIRTLLALLQHAADQDEPGERRFRNASRLAALASSSAVTYPRVQKWVSRLDAAVASAFREEAGLAERLVERDPARGYRLGAGFQCHGLDLLDEVTRCERRLRSRYVSN